jgi:hypothetical protein
VYYPEDSVLRFLALVDGSFLDRRSVDVKEIADAIVTTALIAAAAYVAPRLYKVWSQHQVVVWTMDSANNTSVDVVWEGAPSTNGNGNYI